MQRRRVLERVLWRTTSILHHTGRRLLPVTHACTTLCHLPIFYRRVRHARLAAGLLLAVLVAVVADDGNVFWRTLRDIPACWAFSLHRGRCSLRSSYGTKFYFPSAFLIHYLRGSNARGVE